MEAGGVRERVRVRVEWDGAKNKMAASQAPKNYNAIWSPFCFLTVMLLWPYAPSPFLCVCVDIVVFFFYFCLFRGFFFFFRFSMGRVGALMATSSLPLPLDGPPAVRQKFPPEFRALFSFIYISKATRHGKKLLSRRTADVFTRFRCQSCVNYAIKLTWMSFVQHAKGRNAEPEAPLFFLWYYATARPFSLGSFVFCVAPSSISMATPPRLPVFNSFHLT